MGLKSEMKNQSREIEFILLGLTDDPQLQIVIFIYLFLNYMLSISCTDTRFLELISFVLTGGTLVVTLLLVVFSYTLPYLQELYLYLHEAISKRKGDFIQRCSCYLHLSCPFIKPFYLYSKEPANLLHRYMFHRIDAFCLSCDDIVFTVLLVGLSYTDIIKTILKFPSVQQRSKAFSTCSKHTLLSLLLMGAVSLCT
ncbi:hypothetical protein HPG69_015021 [Diceros bicornis minor]|uniref:Uncharacterized protein n=1 Tax=Diceros bicornis minor TaxID=77932 RepID=A0A7J7FL52_DICBM|nr:hypothetical protein HPG69_015021 [Diceros bicornis minor]